MVGSPKAYERRLVPGRFVRGQVVSNSVESEEHEEPQGNLQPGSEAWGKRGACSMTTVSVSSASSKDEHGYLLNIMVKKVDGRNKYLCAAILDTGCIPSLISESAALRAIDWELTTIKPYNLEPLQGIAKGKKVPVLGKVRLKFFIDDVPYRNTFFVVDEDRFDMLLGAKFLKESGLPWARTTSAEPLPGRL